MHLRTRLHVYAVIPCLALGLLAQDPTPANPAVKGAEPVKIAAHASRWDYPKEIAVAQGTQLHIVQKGDTLWDLGTKYLGNPFAWPQIWELNKWVKDPHWIYPGDPLLVDGSRGVVPQGREEETETPEVAELQPDLRRVPKPTLEEYAYSFQDFIQMPFLVRGTAEAHFKTVGAVRISGKQDKTKNLVGDGDIVYLGGGSNNGLKAGDRFVITKVHARRFYHPDDRNRRQPMGDILQQVGVLRVTRTFAGHSIAIVERSLDGILVGEWAAPFQEPANIVNRLRTDTASPVAVKDAAGRIVFIRESRTVAGGGDMIIMDQGAKAGYKVGDVLLGVRLTPLDTGKNAPNTNFLLGQVIVVRADEGTSTCRVLRTREEMVIGDILTR